MEQSAHDIGVSAVAKRPIKSIGVVVKRNQPQALHLAEKLARHVRSRHITVLAESEIAPRIGADPITREELPEHADLVVVLGGDGGDSRWWLWAVVVLDSGSRRR